MRRTEDKGQPVRAKAFLVEPGTLNVLWMNESAARDRPKDAKIDSGIPVDKAVPMAKVLGLPEALKAAAETGEPQHVRTDISAMAQGRMQLTASVYRLPDGNLLVVMEDTWRAKGRGQE